MRTAVLDQTHNGFDVCHEIIEVDEGELGLQMCILSQMATSVAVLRTETLLDTKHISKSGQTGLEIELRALSEESRLAVVVEAEQSGTTLHLGLNDAGRCDLQKGMGVVCCTEGRKKC
jgi:hypothetical protein